MSIGRRRLVPVLVGLGCGALVAVAAVVVAPRSQEQAPPPPQAPSTEPVGDPGPIAVGPLPYDDASQPPAASGPLLLPIPPPAPPPPPVPPGPPIAAPPPPPAPKPPAGLTGPAAQIVSITNARRRSAGCGALTVDPRLNRSAQRHSEAMASKSFFSHDDPSGHDFADREVAAGFPSDRTGGENIARGYRTAAETMSKWMNSPSHRRNILDCEFKTIGVGYVADGHYWTQNFGF